MGWNHRRARATIGNVLRNVAVILVDTAEAIDPQPDLDLTAVWPFSIQTGSHTKTAEARITWHDTA